uniref:hypothetical protein n=1 Tax=Leyella stercorea TaxID=363265 RepID=UPI003FD7A6BB
MRNVKQIISMAALALCLGFTSCSNDDPMPSYSNVAVNDSELMTILKSRGYQFDDKGKLLLDEKANNTTSLDLSGTKIKTSALKELSVFPNLKELNLSSNGYGPVFHIASLPSQITGLDLQGNDIYDFDGLVTAKVENDEVKATILHEFTKLYLPASCKYNVEDLMPFYTQNEAENKTVDMQMVNDKGSLEKYNTLREIPDTYFAAYLKNLFASIFVDDTHIDISKPLAPTEVNVMIALETTLQYKDIAQIQSISGIEYFINNPYYPDFSVLMRYAKNTEPYTVAYIAPRGNIKGLNLLNTNTLNGIDLSGATKLAAIQLSNNETLKTLDLSKTLIANQDFKEWDALLKNGLYILNCQNLEDLVLPTPNKRYISNLLLIQLPNLKTVNLQDFDGFEYLALIGLDNCKITYPANMLYAYGKENLETSTIPVDLAVSENVFNMEETKAFITKYRAHLNDRYTSYRKFGAYIWCHYL